MTQAIKSNLFLYADNFYLILREKLLSILKNSSTEILQISVNTEWFVDNKIIIHFGEDQTKLLSTFKRKIEKHRDNIIIVYGIINTSTKGVLNHKIIPLQAKWTNLMRIGLYLEPNNDSLIF